MSSSDFSNISFDLPKNQSNVIKVIGVGGGGSNAVNHMYLQGIDGVDFVICNTDAQALQNSPIPTKIQLGVSLTEGLGAGANPEVGEQAAMESIQEIKTMLSSNSKMVFITVGMGGGTGTGAAPVIARVSRELDLLTIGIVTIPFGFEGKMRNDQAYKGIEKLRGYVDSLVVINNNKLREVYGNLGFKAGFSKADEVLSTAARGIAEVITHHYTQNIDLRDAKTVLSNSGTAIMGSASASGENRSEIAISKALDSPLLDDNKITGAKNVLLLIVSGSEEITIDEIGEINDYIQAEAKSNVNIIMGVGEDESLGNAISVTIVATGFNKDQQREISNLETKKIIHTLNDEQEATFDFSEKKLRDFPIKQTSNKIIEIPKADDKIVYDLGDDMDDEEEDFKIISTSEFIKNIEVVYEEIAHQTDNDFVITSFTTQIEEPMLKFVFLL
ncbi:MAG TPA: cell division protein FtsZ, partial [Lutibacter sp.]|nr:cell division protein FtsZ [Lutibacter sp.]